MSKIDEKEDASVDGCLALVALVLWLPLALLWGHVYARLWQWSVVASFGWPALTFPSAVAFWLIIRLLRWKGGADDTAKGKRVLSDTLASGGVALLIWGIAAFAQRWAV